MSLKKISQGCKDYFNVPKDIKGFGKKSTKVKVQTALKWVSYITLLIPAAFGATYAIASLLGRVRKETPKEKSAPVSRVASEVFKTPDMVTQMSMTAEDPLPTAEKEIETNAMLLSREHLLGLEEEKLREVDFSKLTPEKAKELFTLHDGGKRDASKTLFKKLTLDQMLYVVPLVVENVYFPYASEIPKEMLSELDVKRLVPKGLAQLNLPMILSEYEKNEALKPIGEGFGDAETRINSYNRTRVAESLLYSIFRDTEALHKLDADKFATICPFITIDITKIPLHLLKTQ